VGEAGAAAQALTRALAAAGLDIHEFSELAEDGLQRRLPLVEQSRRPVKPSQTKGPRRPGGRPLAMDDLIICDAAEGVFRACRCGGILFTVGPGIGPHHGQLICDACRRGGRWLSKNHFHGDVS
jgi:hypothetical protein